MKAVIAIAWFCCCLTIAAFCEQTQLAADKANKSPEWESVPDSIVNQGYDSSPWPKLELDVRYPDLARTAGVTGKVSAAIHVNAKGLVDSLIIFAKPAGLAFEESVESKLREMQFEPATKEGKPVAAWTWFLFEFYFPKDNWSTGTKDSLIVRVDSLNALRISDHLRHYIPRPLVSKRPIVQIYTH